MKLTSITYRDNIDLANEWQLCHFDLQKTNLIVGYNGTGKSRLLNVIRSLAEILSGVRRGFASTVEFEASFIDEEKTYKYHFSLEGKIVLSERLIIDNTDYIQRDSYGSGFLFSEATSGPIYFKIPNTELAISRRDALHYSYLESLYLWAEAVRHFRFNLESNKNHLGIIDPNTPLPSNSYRETNKAIEAFSIGIKKFGERYKNQVIKDFNQIGFAITDIFRAPLNSVILESDTNFTIAGIHIQEADLEVSTDQFSMSDGMFRALSIVVHLNLFELEQIPSCILIDDVGEGLDYDRATKLIELLIYRSQQSDVQIAMTTNDKFVMNNTPLEFWNVIERKKGKVSIINNKNSPDIFRDFDFTGLNNFDFFKTGFFKDGMENNNE